MEWTKYTTKEALKDNDELMILDKDANANKRTLMDKVWNYVVDKMTTAVIAKLGTTNKTLIGAVNELNSKTFGRAKVIGGIDTKGVEITVKSKNTFYGVLILSNNQDLQLYNIPVSPTLNTTVGQAKIEIDNLTMRITFKSQYTHYACILGGSIANGTIKEIKE
jgi:hypothetical protein